MTVQEYVKFLNFISENNSLNTSFSRTYRKPIKYIESSFDTRDGKVWSINIRLYGDKTGTTFVLQTESDIKSMYDWVNELA